MTMYNEQDVAAMNDAVARSTTSVATGAPLTVPNVFIACECASTENEASAIAVSLRETDAQCSEWRDPG